MDTDALRNKALQMKLLAEEILVMLCDNPKALSASNASNKVIEEIRHYVQAANTDPMKYTPLDAQWAIENKLFKKVGNYIYFQWRNLGVGIVNGDGALELIGAMPIGDERKPRISLPYTAKLLARLTGEEVVEDTTVPQESRPAQKSPKTTWATY